MAKPNYRTRRLWWLLLMVSVLAAIWHFGGLSINHRENDLGFSEEAKRNPLLAATLLWQKRGLDMYYQRGSESFDQLSELGANSLIIASTTHELRKDQDAALWHWISRGGHLISNVAGEIDNDTQQIQDPWLKRVGLVAKLYSDNNHSDLLAAATLGNQCNCCRKDNLQGHLNGHTLTIASSELLYFLDPKNQATIRFKREGNIELIQVAYGKGKVTFVSDLTIWNNKSIDCHDHAYVLTQLAGDQELWAIHHTQLPSLFSMLWQHAKLAVLLALLCLSAWIWHQSRRLGPILPPTSLQRRGLMEHLHASILFAWNHQQILSHIDGLRQQILQRMALHHPGFRDLDLPTQYQLIAERCQLENTQVTWAMQIQEVRKNPLLINLVQALQHIRNQL